MGRAYQTQATMMLEVEFDLSGMFQPGYPATGPSYASGGEPGEPDGIEDAEITGIFIDRVKRDRFGLPEFTDQKKVYERVDLLSKLSPQARSEVLQALSDVLDHEISEHLLEEAE